MPKEKVFIVHTLEDLIKPSMEIISGVKEELLNKGVIIFLHGELATGKTAFVQEFARVVGIESRVQSPTFTLMKSYDVDSAVIPELYKMVHIDAYRMEPHHKEALNVEDFLEEPGTLVFIEWPTCINLDLSLSFASMNFSVLSETLRKVVIKYT